jgi:hypothetical protein
LCLTGIIVVSHQIAVVMKRLDNGSAPMIAMEAPVLWKNALI